MRSGDNRRRAGEDLARGETALGAGRVLRPAQCERGTISYVFDNTAPAAELKGTKVDQVLVGTCTNGWRLTSMPGTYSSTTT